MRVFKHKVDGKHYRLVKQRDSEANTYLEVDKYNKPTIARRCWTFHPQEQEAIIRGFGNLTEIQLYERQR
jgi:hypothetical protein